ncbi:MAG: urease accessory protein UreE [Proteobacteria bacterium]|nr:urease accessory protein UreE [Pseudomonadota bacterium]MBI3497451.1 urease accessory protein UreE [Pseudomonadota bacterium]
MRRATQVMAAGTWPSAEQIDSITLDYDERHRRRRRYACDGGLEFLLDLPEATVLRQGDGLKLQGGGYVAVGSAAEALVEITASSSAALARLAWHLGNRHLPADIAEGRILIRDDHVIVDMLRRLGAEVRPIQAPFNPEGGAYGQHNHDHRHPHRHEHGDGSDHHHHHHGE